LLHILDSHCWISSDLDELKKLQWDIVSPEGLVCPGYLLTRPTKGPDREPTGVWWPVPNENIQRQIPRLEFAMYNVSNCNDYSSPTGEGSTIRALQFGGCAVARAVNRPSFHIYKPALLILFSLVAFIYGGAHCLAWKSVFPSQIERLLWRTSSIVLMGAGFPLVTCYLLLEKVYYDYEYKRRTGNTRRGISAYRWRIMVYKATKPFLGERFMCVLGYSRGINLDILTECGSPPPHIVWIEVPWLYNTVDYVLKGLLAGTLVAYIFARIYLVVECFIQLFHLEPGLVFSQPSWSTYFPHLG